MPTRVEGGVSFSAELERAAARAQARAVNKWAKKVLDLAVSYAPLGPPNSHHGSGVPLEAQGHPGYLRESGRIIEEATGSVDVPFDVAKVAFDAVYAAVQHEHVEYEHPQGGQAKYLERAFKELLPELPALVAAEVAVEIRGAP